MCDARGSIPVCDRETSCCSATTSLTMKREEREKRSRSYDVGKTTIVIGKIDDEGERREGSAKKYEDEAREKKSRARLGDAGDEEKEEKKNEKKKEREKKKIE